MLQLLLLFFFSVLIILHQAKWQFSSHLGLYYTYRFQSVLHKLFNQFQERFLSDKERELWEIAYPLANLKML